MSSGLIFFFLLSAVLPWRLPKRRCSVNPWELKRQWAGSLTYYDSFLPHSWISRENPGVYIYIFFLILYIYILFHRRKIKKNKSNYKFNTVYCSISLFHDSKLIFPWSSFTFPWKSLCQYHVNLLLDNIKYRRLKAFFFTTRRIYN